MGFRALETSSLEWRAINLEGDAPSATVTSSKTAAGMRALPLPRAAVEILRQLKQDMKKGAKFVFPAEEGSKRAAHLHPESLSRAFTRACGRLGIPDASTHDLRRTCLSGLIELGHELVAERIAGHAPRRVMGRHYDHSRRLKAMREALEDWSTAVDTAADRFRRNGEGSRRAGPPSGEAHEDRRVQGSREAMTAASRSYVDLREAVRVIVRRMAGGGDTPAGEMTHDWIKGYGRYAWSNAFDALENERLVRSYYAAVKLLDEILPKALVRGTGVRATLLGVLPEVRREITEEEWSSRTVNVRRGTLDTPAGENFTHRPRNHGRARLTKGLDPRGRRAALVP